MILSYQDIFDLQEKRHILNPFIPENVGPASVDFTIGNLFIVPTPVYTSKGAKMPRKLDTPYFSQEKVFTSTFVIQPLEFVLATTQEEINVPVEYAVYVEGRSSIGRTGLQVQNAGFIDPGFSGKITLELFNASQTPIEIKAGRRMGQFVFFQLKTPSAIAYNGKYQGQYNTTVSKIEEDREVET